MKTYYFLFICLFLYALPVQAQKVFSVAYANQADVKVFVTDYENQADLKVFKVAYANQAGKTTASGSLPTMPTRPIKPSFLCNTPTKPT